MELRWPIAGAEQATCIVCAHEKGEELVIPNGGDCRDTACDVHFKTTNWIELLKPQRRDLPGPESIVVPELFVEMVR